MHEGAIVGRVHDELWRALEGVEVIVNRTEKRATTNGAGVFTLRVFPKDTTIGFRRLGYRPVVLALRPLPAAHDTILVELRTSPVPLREVTITAAPTKPLRYAFTTKYDDVFLRNRVRLGTLIDRDAIERKYGATTAELLQLIPGVRVSNGFPKGIRFARCHEPGGLAVFIDGMRQRPLDNHDFHETPEVEMLSRVNPADIEMIEVFRGTGQIPGAFHWDGCAVVAIWTRWNR